MLTGAAVVVTRYVVGSIDPLSLAMFRYVVGAVCLLPLIALVKAAHIPWVDRFAMAALGTLFFGLFTLCFNVGLQSVEAARAGTIVASMPLLTLALASLSGIERITVAKFTGVSLAVAGVGLAMSSDGLTPVADGWIVSGDVWLLGAALCGAIYNVGSRRYLRRYPAFAVSFWSMLGGVSVLCLLALATGTTLSPLDLSPSSVAAVLFLGTAAGAFAFTLWIWALSNALPTQVAVYFALNPISAAVLGTMLLGETITARLAAGMVAVVAGIALTSMFGRGAESEPG